MSRIGCGSAAFPGDDDLRRFRGTISRCDNFDPHAPVLCEERQSGSIAESRAALLRRQTVALELLLVECRDLSRRLLRLQAHLNDASLAASASDALHGGDIGHLRSLIPCGRNITMENSLKTINALIGIYSFKLAASLALMFPGKKTQTYTPFL